MEEGACSKQLSGNRLGHKPAPRRRGARRCTDRRGPRGGIRHPRSGFSWHGGGGECRHGPCRGGHQRGGRSWQPFFRQEGDRSGSWRRLFGYPGFHNGLKADGLKRLGAWQTRRQVLRAQSRRVVYRPVPFIGEGGPAPRGRGQGTGRLRSAPRGGGRHGNVRLGRAREDGIAAVHGGDGIDGGSRTKGQCFRTGWASVGESSLGGERRCHFLQGGSVRRQHGHHQRIRGMEAMASRWGRFGHWRRHLGRLGPRCRC